MPAPTIYAGLVGYYKMDALIGGQAADSSGMDFRGTLSNAGLVAGGKFGNALRTTTSAGKMSVVDYLQQRQSPTSRVSVNVWINLDKALNTMWGTPKFCDKTGGTTMGFFLGVLAGGGNVISFRVHNSAGTAYTASYTESATSGWVMVTGVYEGSVVRIYRNGTSQATAAADGTLRFAVADLDNVGLGFEGLIDELSIWNLMLTSGNVTSLYAAGAGLQLIIPNSRSDDFTALALKQSQFIGQPYSNIEADVTALPAAVTLDFVPYLPVTRGWKSNPMLGFVDSPYEVVDSPRRIFTDPNPVIVDVQIDAAHQIIAEANAGPTDAASVTTWWQIEITPDMVFIVAERSVGQVFETNHNQTDSWAVPFGQNWRGLYLTFWIQANEDASQMWSSPPVLLDSPYWDNGSFQPTPLPPGPPLGPPRGPTRGIPGPGVYRPRLVDRSRR